MNGFLSNAINFSGDQRFTGSKYHFSPTLFRAGFTPVKLFIGHILILTYLFLKYIAYVIS